jgi:hypothetical protein
MGGLLSRKLVLVSILVVPFLAMNLFLSSAMAEWPYVKGGLTANYTQTILTTMTLDSANPNNNMLRQSSCFIAGFSVLNYYKATGEGVLIKSAIYAQKKGNTYTIFARLFTDATKTLAILEPNTDLQGIDDDGSDIYLLVYRDHDAVSGSRDWAILKLSPIMHK